MVVNSLTVGTLVSVRNIEIDGFVDGKWTEGIPKVELQVSSEGLDLEGQFNFSLDKVQLDSKSYPKFQDKIGQIVGIPYTLETTKNGQKFGYDDSMPILVFKDKLINLLKPETKEK